MSALVEVAKVVYLEVNSMQHDDWIETPETNREQVKSYYLVHSLSWKRVGSTQYSLKGEHPLNDI